MDVYQYLMILGPIALYAARALVVQTQTKSELRAIRSILESALLEWKDIERSVSTHDVTLAEHAIILGSHTERIDKIERRQS